MLRSAAIVFLVIWLLSLLIFRSAGFNDPGTFWHTRVGELILDKGTFPRTDPFTFPFEGQLWIPQQWLAEVIMALLHRSAGMDGQLLALATLLAGLHAWAYSRLCMAGVPVAIAGFLAIAAWFAGLFHDLVRPHMVTLLLTAWTAARLVDFDRGRIGLRELAMLIPVFILWTNLHGGVLGGMMMLGVAAAGWFGAHLVKRPSPIRHRKNVAWIILIGIGCGLSALVNPFGLEMIHTWQRIVGSTAMKQFVPEHQPLDPFDSSGMVILIVFGCYALLVLKTHFRSVRITWLIPAIWFVLSLNGIRQGPLCIVTCLILAADVWPQSSIGQALTTVTIPKPSRWGWFIPLFAVLFSYSLQATNCQLPLIGRGWARLDDSRWPVSLEPVLRSVVQRVPAGTRIYNDTYFGGYLIRYTPELKIFTDDRFELTGDEWIRQYMDMITDHPERFDERQKQYGFRFALVQTGRRSSKLEMHLLGKPNEWKVIGRHQAAVLFELIP